MTGGMWLERLDAALRGSEPRPAWHRAWGGAARSSQLVGSRAAPLGRAG